MLLGIDSYGISMTRRELVRVTKTFFDILVVENGIIKGSLMGISTGTLTKAGTVTSMQKLWRSLQALGAIAFAYSYSIILLEIQVTNT